MSDPEPRLAEPFRVQRRAAFGAQAARYERVRPEYPSAVFDAISEYGGLGAGSRVLEIGAGTGKATASMVARGWIVDVVEASPQMAAILQARLGDRVAIQVGLFEALSRAPDADLVVCATSFHWLDPAVRLQRIAAALRPGGTAAIIWTRHVRGGSRELFDAADGCYAAFPTGDAGTPLPEESAVVPQTAEFEQSPLFTGVRSKQVSADVAYSTNDYLDLLRTYSETLAAPTAQRDGLLDCIGGLLDRDFGGRIVKRYLYDVILARRRFGVSAGAQDEVGRSAG